MIFRLSHHIENLKQQKLKQEKPDILLKGQ